MPFTTFTPPPSGAAVPLPPPRPVTPVSQLPTRKRMPRRRFWLLVLAFILAMLVFEPVRILGCVLFVFWVFAIGVMPHVAVAKVLIGSHRD